MTEKRIPMRLWYRKSAPCGQDFIAAWDRTNDPMNGWEKWSLPIGNGDMGVNVFGRTETERLQITEKSLENYGHWGELGGGLNNFCELMLDFGHTEVTDYVRELDLDDGIARTAYVHDGVRYLREVFASYPDKVLVVRCRSDRAGTVSLTMRPMIPFLKESAEGNSKRGEVLVQGDSVTIRGEMEYYAIAFEGRFRLLSRGGVLTPAEGGLHLEGADEAVIVAAVGTNYRLESRVFTEPDPKKKIAPYPHPHEFVKGAVEAACERGYDALLARHLEDYRGLMGRAAFEIDPAGMDLPTDELLERYRAGERLGYLEMVYFQYGRHLLVSSSRPGTLPAHLQGAWNAYDSPPWGSGYWHNINVQMNYWPAFPANLAETFTAYADFVKAFLPAARGIADEYIRGLHPENYEGPGKNGWTVGTAVWPFELVADTRIDPASGKLAIGHSGPGMGGFTAIPFWDWYAFTGDGKILREVTWPLLREMAVFLEKNLVPVDGNYLASPSASPEQLCGDSGMSGGFYHTVGCAFDQQLIWECLKDLLEAASLLDVGDEDPVVRTARRRLDQLDPVQVGASGQVKEFREEQFYGEIGEKAHRHISHLCGLYPGSVINRDTPEWLAAARRALDLRGDKSTGWAMAHRLCCRARALDAEGAWRLYRTLLSAGTFPNLWDCHPPFQIDGNFGGTAGVCEMLLQSQAGYLDVLPALPEAWAKKGCFRGLVGRGNFTVDADWRNGRVRRVAVTARSGGTVRIRCGTLPITARAEVNGVSVPCETEDSALFFDLAPGDRLEIMTWEIREVREGKKQHLDLLLLADEQESMVDRYLDRGTMFVLEEDGLVRGEVVVTDEGDGVLEVKNLAVRPEDHGMGYGKLLLDFVSRTFSGRYAVLQVGTGESPATLPFYEACGFREHHRIENFFTDNYDAPIWDGGVLLRDMIVLRRPMGT